MIITFKEKALDCKDCDYYSKEENNVDTQTSLNMIQTFYWKYAQSITENGAKNLFNRGAK